MDLSILIPSRNEMWLPNTIKDILSNIEGDTEIIVVLDGQWTAIEDDPRITLVYLPESIGQRAATNLACSLSKAKYVMKVDAHCSFDKGFDVKMMADMQDDWTLVPNMKNLHVFDWVCDDGHRRYQGPSGVCTECGKPTHRDVLWRAKPSPNSTSYCFDPTPHFQYFGEFKHRPGGRGDITETMSLQGSCFMLTREKYWELNICDESFGSWGSQGIEVAVKTWLSGGRVMCNHKTWYAHLFRTQGGDFGFPYPQSGRQVERAKLMARDIFFNNKWDKAIHPLSWLLEKFWPVPGWTEDDLAKLKSGVSPELKVTENKIEVEAPSQETDREVRNRPIVYKHKKGIIYYTDNQLDPKLMKICQDNISSIGLPIISVSLKPIDFGTNIVLPLERGKLTYFKQILIALLASEAEIIYFCEHDCLYSKSHFDFIPPRKDRFYYDSNWWRVRLSDGHAVQYTAKQANFQCGYRELYVPEYMERVRRVEKDGFHKNGFEPGTRSIRRGGFTDARSEFYTSELPSIDIRHDTNLSASKWKPEDFLSQRSCQNWKERENDLPYWGKWSDIWQ